MRPAAWASCSRQAGTQANTHAINSVVCKAMTAALLWQHLRVNDDDDAA
jgi:hypothetical protein